MESKSWFVRMCFGLFALLLVGADYTDAQNAVRTNDIVIDGVVTDRGSRKKLENVSVVLCGTNIGTVSNAEGVFSLKIPADSLYFGIELSYLGYVTAHLTEEELRKNGYNVTVRMSAADNVLDEVVVYGGDARRIMQEALRKIKDNYPDGANMLSMFYRETIQKRHRYIGISEAMMSVYKTAYSSRNMEHDKVRIEKGRRLLSQKSSDTLAVKVVGGPVLSLSLDAVKNGNILFNDETLGFYSFKQEPSVMINDRMQIVISFTPRVYLDYALLIGKAYIDKERLAFTRLEFALDLSDRNKATAEILRKKPVGLRFRPQEVSFLVSYRWQGEKSFLNYIRNTIRFKCDWKRRLFSSGYTACSEMVTVDRNEHPEETIKLRDAFKSQQMFYDVVLDYWNEEYWGDYNIIEPTESLENAVKRLKKQHGGK